MLQRTLHEIGIADRIVVEQDSIDPSRVIIFFDHSTWIEMNDSQRQAVKAEIEQVYDRMRGCALTPEVLYAVRSLVVQRLLRLIQMESAPGRFK